MAKSKQAPEFEVQVDRQSYMWRLHRQPGWSSDNNERHGMAIAVRHKEGQREAVVEFPPGPEQKYGAPLLKPAAIAPDLVTNAIASAVAAGWDPLSRGKTVTIVVDSTGG